MNILIKIKKKQLLNFITIVSFLYGDPYGNRTHDSALRGPRLNRLTKGPYIILYIYNINKLLSQEIKTKN